MSAELLRAAKAEQQRLEADIRTASERLDAVRRVIALYEIDGGASEGVLIHAEAANGGAEKYGSGQSGQIRALAAAYLREKGAPATAREIYGFLVERGVTINAQKPTSIVSSRLSQLPMFESGPGGYGLAS